MTSESEDDKLNNSNDPDDKNKFKTFRVRDCKINRLIQLNDSIDTNIPPALDNPRKSLGLSRRHLLYGVNSKAELKHSKDEKVSEIDAKFDSSHELIINIKDRENLSKNKPCNVLNTDNAIEKNKQPNNLITNVGKTVFSANSSFTEYEKSNNANISDIKHRHSNINYFMSKPKHVIQFSQEFLQNVTKTNSLLKGNDNIDSRTLKKQPNNDSNLVQKQKLLGTFLENKKKSESTLSLALHEPIIETLNEYLEEPLLETDKESNQYDEKKDFDENNKTLNICTQEVDEGLDENIWEENIENIAKEPIESSVVVNGFHLGRIGRKNTQSMIHRDMKEVISLRSKRCTSCPDKTEEENMFNNNESGNKRGDEPPLKKIMETFVNSENKLYCELGVEDEKVVQEHRVLEREPSDVNGFENVTDILEILEDIVKSEIRIVEDVELQICNSLELPKSMPMERLKQTKLTLRRVIQPQKRIYVTMMPLIIDSIISDCLKELYTNKICSSATDTICDLESSLEYFLTLLLEYFDVKIKVPQLTHHHKSNHKSIRTDEDADVEALTEILSSKSTKDNQRKQRITSNVYISNEIQTSHSMKQTILLYEAKIRQLLAIKSEIETANEQLKELNRTLQKRHATMVGEFKQEKKEIQFIKSQTQVMLTRIQTVPEKLTDLETENLSLRSEIKDLEKTLAQRDQLFASERQINASLSEEIIKLESDSVNKELMKNVCEEFENLNEEYEILKRTLEETEDKLFELAQDRDNLLKHSKVLEDHLFKLKAENNYYQMMLGVSGFQDNSLSTSQENSSLQNNGNSDFSHRGNTEKSNNYDDNDVESSRDTKHYPDYPYYHRSRPRHHYHGRHVPPPYYSSSSYSSSPSTQRSSSSSNNSHRRHGSHHRQKSKKRHGSSHKDRHKHRSQSHHSHHHHHKSGKVKHKKGINEVDALINTNISNDVALKDQDKFQMPNNREELKQLEKMYDTLQLQKGQFESQLSHVPISKSVSGSSNLTHLQEQESLEDELDKCDKKLASLRKILKQCKVFKSIP